MLFQLPTDELQEAVLQTQFCFDAGAGPRQLREDSTTSLWTPVHRHPVHTISPQYLRQSSGVKLWLCTFAADSFSSTLLA